LLQNDKTYTSSKWRKTVLYGLLYLFLVHE